MVKQPCHRWTAEQDQWLREHYSGTTSPVLAKQIDVSQGAITNRVQSLGLLKSHLWTQGEEEWLRANFEMSDKVLAVTLGTSVRSIRGKAFELGLQKTEWRWTLAEKRDLRKRFSTTDNGELAKRFGVTRNAIAWMGKEMGLKKTPACRARRARELGRKLEDLLRIYELDQRYFSRIDSPDKAYWMGWLWADGCIDGGRQSGHNGFRVRLALAVKDAKIVHRFAQAIKTTAPVSIEKKRGSGKAQPKATISLSSRLMVQDLISKGVVPRKTFHAGIPHIPKRFFAQFIRGVFDGDGTICRSGKSPRIGICGTYSFCKWLEMVLQPLGLFGSIYRYRSHFLYYLGGVHNCSVFAKYIYRGAAATDDAVLLLERKHERFVKWGLLSHKCVLKCDVLRETGGFRRGDIVLVRGIWTRQICSIQSGSGGALRFAGPERPLKAQPRFCELVKRPAVLTYYGRPFWATNR